MQRSWRLFGAMSSMFYICSHRNPAIIKTDERAYRASYFAISRFRVTSMRWAPRSFPVKIHRHLNVADLVDISPDELEQAEEEGALAGNRSYCDLRGCGWDVVRTALDIETKVIDRLKMADDVEAEMSAFEEERATAFDWRPTLGARCRSRLRDNRDFGLRRSPCVQLQRRRFWRTPPSGLSLRCIFSSKGLGP
jgi:hypothetical protein